MPVDVGSLCKRHARLKAMRGVWESHWQEIADFMLPRRGDITRKRTPGAKRTEYLYDGTAMRSLALLAASLHGMLTSQATPWFQLALDGRDADVLMEDPDVQLWLSDVEREMYSEFARSNFETEIHELYLDLASIGTSCMYIEDDAERKVVRFSTRHIAEVCVAEDKYGRVDTIFRDYELSARAAVQRWGIEAVGEAIKKKFEQAPDDMVTILHVIMPREDYAPGKRNKRNKPVASVYISPAHKHLISEDGFDEFPAVVPRYGKASGEVYGRSPGMDALPDTKVVNKMSEVLLKAAAKIVDPPLMAPDDGFLGPVKTMPGGVNYYRAGTQDRIEPLVSGANIPLGIELEEQRREAVRNAFYADQLVLKDGPQMTATEVITRTEEKMRMLGPVLGRLQSELLEPLIDRVFAIMFRRGAFGALPPKLSGRRIKVRYVSPMARAQRAVALQGIQRYVEIAAPLSPVMPQLMELLSPEALPGEIADILGVPMGVRRTKAQQKQVREAGDAEREAAQGKMDAQALAGGARDIAKAGKDANVDVAGLLGLPAQPAAAVVNSGAQ